METQKYQGLDGMRMALETMLDMAKLIEKIKSPDMLEVQFSPRDKIEFDNLGFNADYQSSDGTEYKITIMRTKK